MIRIKYLWLSIKRFGKAEQGFPISLEMAVILALLGIFLAIAIPSLLTHMGSLFTRTNTQLDGYVQ